jgi:predicted RND superfamily exporter protein
VVSILLFVASTIGLYRLKPVSYMMDDVPSDSELLSDLRFVEDRFQGVMPFEILIDTDRKRAAIKRSNLKKTVELQERLTSYSPLSRTVSIADVTRYIRQVFFDGGKEDYVLPTRSEYDFIKLYLNNTSLKADRLSKALSDSNLQTIRISGNIRDIGSIEMGKLVDSIRTDLDDIFDPLRNQTHNTRTTKNFILGNEYLIQNLLESLALAFFVIALIMGFLFKSLRIVIISLVPNFLPLLMVAGVMGYLGIALKPSSALVFSVAFGIAVDDSIHFLARYRLGLQMGNTVGEAISNSFKDTGVSMIYTSIILFFGFVIFTASSFGGTEALGLLASSTLAIAMFSNLFLLPALLLTFEPKSQELPGPLAHRAAQARSEKHDVSSQEES